MVTPHQRRRHPLPLLAPGTLIGSAQTERPEPVLGPHRYVCKLPAGVAGRLAFLGFGSEPGAGYLDVTARVTSAGEWLPISVRVGRTDYRSEVLDDGLSDAYELRHGALLRQPGAPAEPSYWLHAGGEYFLVERLLINQRHAPDLSRADAVLAQVSADSRSSGRTVH
ncbi:hypothetical protein [Micromonospora sp. NPDC049645]|uniref:hypothetical protein n=1 Tax=Micromonospora sp. NPDC049645 TaxID=3155508 RepID=UPI003441E5B6